MVYSGTVVYLYESRPRCVHLPETINHPPVSEMFLICQEKFRK